MTASLFDTHVLLWAMADHARLSRRAMELVASEANVRWFSPVSIGEIAIKWQQGRPDFPYSPYRIRDDLLRAGLQELPLTALHACRLAGLPPIHKDPFDRLMVAQALAEGVPFVTADAVLANYPGQVIVV